MISHHDFNFYENFSHENYFSFSLDSTFKKFKKHAQTLISETIPTVVFKKVILLQVQ